MDKEESLLGQVRPIDTGGGDQEGNSNQLWHGIPKSGVTPKDNNKPPSPPPVQEPDYVDFSKRK
jgi:hypothetical protein